MTAISRAFVTFRTLTFEPGLRLTPGHSPSPTFSQCLTLFSPPMLLSSLQTCKGRGWGTENLPRGGGRPGPPPYSPSLGGIKCSSRVSQHWAAVPEPLMGDQPMIFRGYSAEERGPGPFIHRAACTHVTSLPTVAPTLTFPTSSWFRLLFLDSLEA